MSVHVFTYRNNFNAVGHDGPNEDVHVFHGADSFELMMNRDAYTNGIIVKKGDKNVGYVVNPLRVMVMDEPELEGDAG